MKIKQTKFSKALLIGIFISLVPSFIFSACGRGAGDLEIISATVDEFVTIEPVDIKNELHTTTTDNSNLKLIVKSGLTQLYLDEKTYSAVVCDTLKDSYWYSLPQADLEDESLSVYDSAVVKLTLVDEKRVYLLNSQDNSLAFGSASYELLFDEDTDGTEENRKSKVTPRGFKVTYVISNKKETAHKDWDDLEEDDLVYVVSVSYRLKDGSLYATCEYENKSVNKAPVLKELSFLEDFGAHKTAEKDDFLLVPDKSGALILTGLEDDDFEEKVFRVYGDENTLSDESGEEPAIIAAYALKKEDSVCAVIIEKGDAIAKIHADRAKEGEGFNKVGPRFEITAVSDLLEGKKQIRSISPHSYEGEIQLCMRFRSGGAPDYSLIAAMCREQLIRDNFLSNKNLEKSENLPFNLTVIGGAKAGIFKKLPLEFMSGFTKYDQAQDMLSRMKSKGINSIDLNYVGALSGGIGQRDAAYAKPMFLLGGKKGLSQLNDYMKNQKLDLFLNLNLFSFEESRFSRNTKKALDLSGNLNKVQAPGPLVQATEQKTFTRSLRHAGDIDKAGLKILSNSQKVGVGGFSIEDAGSFLYTDACKNGADRQTIAEYSAEQIKSLSTGRKIMINKGNFFALKNADIVTNLPMPCYTGEEKDSAYRYIPFVQMILHGVIDYSGRPVNLVFDSYDMPENLQDLEFSNLMGRRQKALKDIMLKNIEYCANPAYVWTYKPSSSSKQAIDVFYYDDWINQAADYYSKANAALADLRDLRILKHTQLAPGVFSTELEGGRFIYVNYTFEDFALGSLTVKARDFLKI
ncbi:MAG: hypothetical protein GX345_02020 [Clostridiales bacterium]|nr:hypothetical protein [Clostridiales bacterium]